MDPRKSQDQRRGQRYRHPQVRVGCSSLYSAQKSPYRKQCLLKKTCLFNNFGTVRIRNWSGGNRIVFIF